MFCCFYFLFLNHGPWHWYLFAAKNFLTFFASMHILSRCRKPFVGSLKSLVICQFWWWHNTKSPTATRKRRLILFTNRFCIFSPSYCDRMHIHFEIPFNSIEWLNFLSECNETCSLSIISTNDHASCWLLCMVTFRKCKSIASNQNRNVMLQIYWWSFDWTNSVCSHVIYECDATTRTLYMNVKFTNLNEVTEPKRCERKR